MRQQLHGSYVIYSDGRIYSTHKGKFLKPYLNDKGYQKVRICENGSFKMWTVHRLVATMFLKQEKGKNQVNHKNGIKTDNRVENLEWCTNSENQKHSWAMGLIKSGHARLVLDTLTGVYYESATELAKLIGVNRVTLIGKLNGNRSNDTRYQYV